jgi:lipid A 3-O-deacylase
MKSHLLAAAACLALSVSLAAPARAEVDELRVGVTHNFNVEHNRLTDGREGDNVEGELVWSSPELFGIIGSPRPYVVGSFNTEGKTSFVGAGVLWRWNFAHNWAFEPGFGFIVHNGEIDNPYPDGSAQAAQFQDEHQLLGSRDLFRETFALERSFGDHAALQVYYEHASHGQILNSGRNQGLNNVGLRYVWRFHANGAQ